VVGRESGKGEGGEGGGKEREEMGGSRAEGGFREERREGGRANDSQRKVGGDKFGG